MEVQAPDVLRRPLNIPRKTLMGPGPSNCSPRVLEAMGSDVVGHMHEEVFQAMDEVKAGIQYVFQTKNELTLAISASGHAGMEAIFSNLVEAGDRVIICCNGIWGNRAFDIAQRNGAIAKIVYPPGGLGDNFPHDFLESVIRQNRPKLLFIVQGESSAGVYQPLEGLGDICERYNCLLAVDTVASLGGVPFFMDRWKIDAVYTGSQKVVGAPPGITPISFSSKAKNVIYSRKTPVPVYYWDMTVLGQQWKCFNNVRPYHHTTSSNLIFALREALAQIVEEGLDTVQRRHQECAQRLYKGIEKLGLKLFVQDPAKRLPTVTTIKVSEKWSWREVVVIAMRNYRMEIAGGLGPSADKVLRIGLMGYNATPEKVDEVLKVLGEGVRYAERIKSSKL